MRNLFFGFATLFITVANAHALTPVALLCGKSSVLFVANLDSNYIEALDQSRNRMMWNDNITSVKYKIGFETFPAQTQITVALSKGGQLSGMIVDKVITDAQGSYKEVRNCVYNGPMSGNENYTFTDSSLFLE